MKKRTLYLLAFVAYASVLVGFSPWIFPVTAVRYHPVFSVAFRGAVWSGKINNINTLAGRVGRGEFNDDAVKQVITDAIHSASEDDRYFAVNCWLFLDTPKACPPVSDAVRLCSDKSDRVVAHAALILGQAGDDAIAFETLRKLANAENDDVRVSAKTALTWWKERLPDW